MATSYEGNEYIKITGQSNNAPPSMLRVQIFTRKQYVQMCALTVKPPANIRLIETEDLILIEQHHPATKFSMLFRVSLANGKTMHVDLPICWDFYEQHNNGNTSMFEVDFKKATATNANITRLARALYGDNIKNWAIQS